MGCPALCESSGKSRRNQACGLLLVVLTGGVMGFAGCRKESSQAPAPVGLQASEDAEAAKILKGAWRAEFGGAIHVFASDGSGVVVIPTGGSKSIVRDCGWKRIGGLRIFDRPIKTASGEDSTIWYVAKEPEAKDHTELRGLVFTLTWGGEAGSPAIYFSRTDTIIVDHDDYHDTLIRVKLAEEDRVDPALPDL